MGKHTWSRRTVAALAAVTAATLTGSFGIAKASAAGLTITVAPDTNLVSGQSINISGTGAPSDTFVAVSQCQAGATDIFSCSGPLGFTQTDATGAFQTDLVVARFIGTDCAITSCVVAVAFAPDTAFATTRPLTFDPNGPVPTITVTPSQNLPFHPQVNIVGDRWGADSYADIEQCTSDRSACSFSSAPISTDSVGHADANVYVRRTITSFGPNGNAQIDCATIAGGCAVFAHLQDGSLISAPITFNPNSIVPPPPTITVTPNQNLVDHQIINISGINFTPGSLTFTSQCAASEHFTACIGSGLQPAEASGRIPTTAVGVRRSMAQFGEGVKGVRTSRRSLSRRLLASKFGNTNDRAVASNAPLDCAAATVHCSIEVSNLEDGVFNQELTFNRNGHPTPAPIVTARPTRALKDGQHIRVRGRGFVPGEFVAAAVCLRHATVFGPQCSFVQSELTADRQGHIKGSVRITRLIASIDHRTDCAHARCYLRIFGSDDRAKPIRLHFDRGAPLPPPPSITVSPSTGIVDGQALQVAGSGFNSGPVLFGECVTDGTANPTMSNIVGCVDIPDSSFTDSSGHFVGMTTAHQSIALRDGSVADCANGAACVILAISLNGPTYGSLAAIQFAG